MKERKISEYTKVPYKRIEEMALNDNLKQGLIGEYTWNRVLKARHEMRTAHLKVFDEEVSVLL